MIMVIIPDGPAIRFESRCHGKSEKRGGLCRERASEHVALGGREEEVHVRRQET